MPIRQETERPKVSHLVTGHFREGPGYAAWRSRGTPDWLLIFTGGGLGRFGYKGGEIISERGDLMLLAPGSLHDYGVEDTRRQWELIWTHFYARPHWHELLQWPEIAPGLHCIRPRDADAIRDLEAMMLEVHRLATSGTRLSEMLAMNALERLLLACDVHNPLSSQSQLDPRVRRAMERVCANLAAKHRMPELAAVAGLSVSRLAHLFRQQTGQSPQQFIELQRIGRAKELLRLSSRTIQTIALDVGFENPFYFTSRFKKHTGRSPRGYRQATAE